MLDKKRFILFMSLLVIVVTLIVGIVGVLDFNKCKESHGKWNFEKKICEHILIK